jgi:hypothetical protein
MTGWTLSSANLLSISRTICRVSRGRLYRLPIDQLVKLPLAIATEVPLGAADIILVELLVEVVGRFR